MTIKNTVKLGSLVPALALFVLSSYFLLETYGYYMHMTPWGALLLDYAFVLFPLALLLWILSIALFLYSRRTLQIVDSNTKSLKKAIQGSVKNLEGEIPTETKNLIEVIDLESIEGIHNAYAALEALTKTTKIQKASPQKESEIKSLFVSNISHEIRTPMNGIIGFTELLKDTELNDEQKEFVSVIEKSSENLLDIINHILDLTKIENKNLHLEQVVFNTNEQLETVVKKFSSIAAEKNITFNYFRDPAISTELKGDLLKLKEVLSHLLSNAIKFTNYGGEVTLRIQKESADDNKSLIRFLIEDTGIGITKQQLVKIFQAFSRGESNTSKKYAGAGLGLTISKQYVEFMGGELEVKSQEDKGSVFSFAVPLEELSSSSSSLMNAFSNLSLYTYAPNNHTLEQQIYLSSYAKYYGAMYTSIDTIDSLINLVSPKTNQPYLLLVHLDNIDDTVLDKLKAIDKRSLVVIAYTIPPDTIEKLSLPKENILHKPLLLSELEACMMRQTNRNQKYAEKTKVIASTRSVFSGNVLIVEDNLINQKLAINILESFGLNVDVANNGLEGFEKRKNGNFDLIFMDIQMPVMDGIEATHKILEYEKDENRDHVPIVTLTANALQGDKERFLKEGLDEYISKPIDRGELLYILNKFIPERRTVELTETHRRTDLPARHSLEPEDEIKITKSKPNMSKKILIAQKSILANKILSKIIEKLGYVFDVVSDKETFMDRIQKEDYLAIFANEALIRYLPKETEATFILTEDPDNDTLKAGMKYYKVESLMQKKSLETTLKAIEENR